MRARPIIVAFVVASLLVSAANGARPAAPRLDLSDHLVATLGPGIATYDVPLLPLRAAVEALDARLGVARPAGALDGLDALDPALAAPVADLLSTLLVAAAVRDAAYAGVSTDDLVRLTVRESAPDADAILARVDAAALRAAAALLADAVDRTLPALETYRLSLPPAPALAPGPPLVNLPPVLVLDPLGVENVYAKDAVLALDLGGSDVYDMNAGGSIIAMGPVGDPSTYQYQALGFAIGGEFEDAFLSFTAALALDLDGDDHYGVLKDPRVGSTDRICTTGQIVRRIVIQGSGSGGIGVLVDARGNDVYRGKTLAQGDGHIAGVGFFADFTGNDEYYAIRSARGSAVLGGAGVFLDAAGNDLHVFEAPPGGLFNVDSGRCDAVGRLGLGGAVQDAAASYTDLGGIDTYRIESQAFGFGSAFAFGSFADIGGEADDYGGYPGRGNGQALPSASGLFVDA